MGNCVTTSLQLDLLHVVADSLNGMPAVLDKSNKLFFNNVVLSSYSLRGSIVIVQKLVESWQ